MSFEVGSDHSGDGRTDQPRVHGLDTLFSPRSIALVGASSHEMKIGGRPLRMLRDSGYEGAIYPINPRYEEVQGLPCYPSIATTPTTPDLAIVAVPGQMVLDTVQECVDAGVKVLVLFSAGFAESGPEGVRQQQELARLASTRGVRILGPNCIGAANLAEGVVATFASALMVPRSSPASESPRIGLVSQSGAIGGHAVALAAPKGFAFDPWLTTGNEADIDVADGVAYLAGRDDVTTIAVYLEGARDGLRLRQALRLAQEAGKPVILLKSGTSDVGAAAAASHTASLVGSDDAYDVMFSHYGVCRVNSITELVDTAYAVSHSGLPSGNRVAIFSGSGGGGILMADSATNAGLQVPVLDESVQARLKEIWPAAGVANPIDTTAQMTNDPKLFPALLDVVLAHRQHDMVLVFLTYVALLEPWRSTTLEALRRVRQEHPRAHILISALADEQFKAATQKLNMPCFEELKDLVDTAGRLAQIAHDQHDFQAREKIDGADLQHMPRLASSRVPSEDEAKALLSTAGVPVVPDRLVADEDEAVEAAEEFGYPVVLKVVSPDIPHKSDIGGVELNLTDATQVRAAFSRIWTAVAEAVPDAHINGILVSPMVQGGVETILGVKNDPSVGMTIAVGLGGVHVEVLRELSVRLAPVTDSQALEMIREVRGFELLDGARGAAKADIETLASALSRLSLLATANADRIESIDVNPFVALTDGGFALDALIQPLHPDRASQ